MQLIAHSMLGCLYDEQSAAVVAAALAEWPHLQTLAYAKLLGGVRAGDEEKNAKGTLNAHA